MDSFVVKYTDPLAVIKNQSELHLKDKEEPPVKKIRHDNEFPAVASNEVVILEENLDNTVEDINGFENQNKSTEMTSENSKSNGSPECEHSERDRDECRIIEKDQVSPPQQKRRKISLKEKEERLKEKEEAKLLKEKKLQEKKQEKEEMRQKKDQERLEKEKEKQARKEQIEKERLEKEKEKQIKKEKLEKERLEKQKKKEELNLAKEEERKKRDEEKRQKEEERKQKEDEKRKKDEERKLKEEEDQRRKDKVKESFKSFFIKKSPPKKVATSDEKFQLFAPFEVKPNMTMAPVLRRKQIENSEMFLELIENQDSSYLYVNELRKRIIKEKIQYRSGRYLRHLFNGDQNDKTDKDILIVDENGDENDDEKSKPKRDLDTKNVMPVKLLQFSENYRPPYYGTWRKRSKKISPRNPFKKDEELLNYEIDSDEEWEEEEPGESLSGTEHEDEEEEEEDNDGEDDGFFVPHGYLSDDEGVNGSDGEKEEHVDIRDKKLDKTEGFPFGSKGKIKQLRATCFGSAWFTADDDVPACIAIYKVKPMAIAPIDIFTIKQETGPKSSNQNNGPEIVTPRSGNNLPLKVPEEAMPMLIKHVHKSNFGVNKLIRTFLAMWNQERNENDDIASTTRPRISKRQLERKILEIAKRETFADSSKPCYFVHKHVLDAYDTNMDSLQNESQSVNNNMVTSPGFTKACNVSGTTDTSFDIKYAAQRCETVPSQDDRSKNGKSLSSLPIQNLHKPEEEVNKTQTQREIIIV